MYARTLERCAIDLTALVSVMVYEYYQNVAYDWVRMLSSHYSVFSVASTVTYCH
jgi:hypothetical protein